MRSTAAPPHATTAPANDQALASSILMTGADMPADWLDAHKTAATDAATFAAACHRDTQPGMTARAISDDFLFDGQSPSLSEVVVVFGGEVDAHASFAGAEAYVDCVVVAINTGQLHTPRVAFSGAASEAVQLTGDTGEAGDEALAFRVRATQTADDLTTATAQYTFVFGRKGRVVYELLWRGSGSPIEVDEVADFAATAAGKLP